MTALELAQKMLSLFEGHDYDTYSNAIAIFRALRAQAAHEREQKWINEACEDLQQSPAKSPQ